ncbi:hypothetical protein [Photobacterium phosphoreum]|uniref:hypothetical protein n=1 Tax=Photobacterium phosphoreum TaxID=659 RepID=UPI000D183A7F|nr:hypothetical protein [Photobacterium phosphoreum]PSU32166.1 hypothetical protein CTM85_20215 [Photobacterium phosphoreum]
MFRKLNLFFKRAALSSDEIKEAKRIVKFYALDYESIQTINTALNAQRVAESLELLGSVQNLEKDIIYYNRETNQIEVKSLLDD